MLVAYGETINRTLEWSQAFSDKSKDLQIFALDLDHHHLHLLCRLPTVLLPNSEMQTGQEIQTLTIDLLAI